MATAAIQPTSAQTASEPSRAAAADAEHEAAALFEEAVEELELGERRRAMQRLEIIVERYANTRTAGAARALLSQIGSRRALAPRPQNRRARSDGRGEGGGAEPIATAIPAHLDAEFKAVAGDRIFFSDASSAIGGRARLILREQAEWLRRHPELGIRIEGHADDTGTHEHNVEMSRQRAESVRERLVEDGIAAERITLAAAGRDQRVAVCPQPECTAQNRRVVVRLVRSARAAAPAERR